LANLIHEHFAEYAVDTNLPSLGGSLADGRAFAQWLAARGKLPAAARLHALAIDLRYKLRLEGLRPRRGPSAKVALLRNPCRLVVGIRVPRIGERWLAIPLWRD
jgi:hypothetical protein